MCRGGRHGHLVRVVRFKAGELAERHDAAEKHSRASRKHRHRMGMPRAWTVTCICQRQLRQCGRGVRHGQLVRVVEVVSPILEAEKYSYAISKHSRRVTALCAWTVTFQLPATPKWPWCP